MNAPSRYRVLPEANVVPPLREMLRGRAAGMRATANIHRRLGLSCGGEGAQDGIPSDMLVIKVGGQPISVKRTPSNNVLQPTAMEDVRQDAERGDTDYHCGTGGLWAGE